MSDENTKTQDEAVRASRPPKMGPKPMLLSRKEVDALYETLQAVQSALETLGVDAIVTGGSLLGAIRQQSILFCDDDVDMAIIDYDGSVYENTVKPNLSRLLGSDYLYQVRPWEGGDRIRPQRMSNVFLDLFVLRRFESVEDLKSVIGVKKNGRPQSEEYVNGILDKLDSCVGEKATLCPFWHFSTRKAIEMWTKEVYRESELFPLKRNLKMGPVTGVCGLRMPVLLLKRAFGEDCFDAYFQSVSHQSGPKLSNSHHEHSTNTELPPLLSAAGTWEGGVKSLLCDEHYLPIQPISKAARRPTLHNKAQLQEYLAHQTKSEDQWIREQQQRAIIASADHNPPKQRTIYMDGVFDLFHIGHLEAIRQCSKLGDRVVIGVTGDEDATGYKRQPIVPEGERCAIIKSLKEVDDIVCPCPLVVTEEFMAQHNIDLVVHGFANDADAKRQEEFFEIPTRLGKFQRIPYYNGMSTTDRIKCIQSQAEDEQQAADDREKPAGNPQWFGTTLRNALGSSNFIAYDPFPLRLRQALESHIEKARQRRKSALEAVRVATGRCDYDTAAEQFEPLACDGSFYFDTETHMLRESLLRDLGFDEGFDLSTMHESLGLKETTMETLTKSFQTFQASYDAFVRAVCAPLISAKFPCTTIYYQTFPCLRMVQPNEFSIGPHSDAAYGHHPCSINFYVPLTQIGGTAALYLESRNGAEDWHPIEGSYGFVKHFPGALCLHWTTDNTMEYTRVSLDFRLIPGPVFHRMKCGGAVEGGQKDVYRANEGYYSVCRLEKDENGKENWARRGPLIKPDARVGFPWTVKDWSKRKS